MITAVLDTNVLASGFAGSQNPKSTPGRLLRLWADGAFELVTSEPILDEFMRTLDDPYFARRLTPGERAANVELLRDESTVMPITQPVRRVATHPEDDLILATAVSGHADYLVTGDGPLQKLDNYEGVAIVSPRAFLEVLEHP